MDETSERHVPLEEMDELQARRLLTEMGALLDPERWYALCHEGYVMEMPQSGERFRGRDNLRAFQRAAPEHYSAPPSIRVDRVLVRDGLWVKEGVNDYGGGRVSHSAVIYELKDGRIWRDTRYYAEPFEAPEWRARWVEGPEAGKPGRTSARDERRNEMDKNEPGAKPVPDLEAMDERDAARLLDGLANKLSPEKEYEIRHKDDYVMEMPQSGERIRGRDNVRAFQESFLEKAAPPSIRVRRVIVREGLWVVESVVDYGGEIAHGAAILELRDGKVWRDTRYFAEPFGAPAWRARWVERMETGV